MTKPVLYLLTLSLFFIAPAVYADEIHISENGQIQAVGKIVGKNALNLLTLGVWGYKFKVFIEHGVRVEDIGGKTIKLDEILEGHTVEIKGRTFLSRSEVLEPIFVRNLSIGNKETAASPSAPAVLPVIAAPNPATGKGALTQDLSLGMRGKEVVVLQEFLQKNNWGIPNDGPVTGHFGKVTKKALMNFQKAKGLAAVGTAGPQTRQLVNSLLSK